MRNATSTRARRRGLAFLEAVMMIPAFALGLWGCVWLHGVYAARHTANHQARACAMAWAVQGCEGSAPNVCSPSTAYGDSPEAIIPDEVVVAGPAGDAERVRVADSLARVPVVGTELQQLERFVGTVGRGDDLGVSRPALLGGGSDILNSHSYALCAPRQRHEPAVSTRDVFCGTMPCGFPGCEGAQADPAVGCVSGP